MVGCFPAVFKKTYVINQTPARNINRRQKPTPYLPRYSHVIDDLNQSIPPFTSSHVDVYDNNLEKCQKNEKTKEEIIQSKEKRDQKNHHNGIMNPANATQLPQSPGTSNHASEIILCKEQKPSEPQEIKTQQREDEKINITNDLLSPQKVEENIYEETGKCSSEIVSCVDQKTPLINKISEKDQNRTEITETRQNDFIVQKDNLVVSKTSQNDSQRINDKTERAKHQENCSYDKTRVNTNALPSEQKSIREPAKLPSESSKHRNLSKIETFEPKKPKVPETTELSEITQEDDEHKTHKKETSKLSGYTDSNSDESIYSVPISETETITEEERPSQSTIASSSFYDSLGRRPRRSGVQPIHYEVDDTVQLPVNPKSEE